VRAWCPHACLHGVRVHLSGLRARPLGLHHAPRIACDRRQKQQWCAGDGAGQQRWRTPTWCTVRSLLVSVGRLAVLSSANSAQPTQGSRTPPAVFQVGVCQQCAQALVGEGMVEELCAYASTDVLPCLPLRGGARPTPSFPLPGLRLPRFLFDPAPKMRTHALLPSPLPLSLFHSSSAAPSVSPAAPLSSTWCRQGADKVPLTRHQAPGKASVQTQGISTKHALGWLECGAWASA